MECARSTHMRTRARADAGSGPYAHTRGCEGRIGDTELEKLQKCLQFQDGMLIPEAVRGWPSGARSLAGFMALNGRME